MGILIVVSIFAGSIFSRRPPGLLVASDSDDMPEQRVVFCTPEFLGQFQYLPVAVVAGEDASDLPIIRSGGYKDSGSRSSCSLERTWQSERIFNVIIRDMASGQQRLLLDNPGQVATFLVPDPDCAEGKGPVPCETIIWSIRRDSNNDGRIDAKDLVHAHVSDLSSRHLQPITPADATVLSVYWSPQSEELLFRIRHDVNSDGKYSDEDGVEIVATSSSNPDMARPIIRDDLMNQLWESVR